MNIVKQTIISLIFAMLFIFPASASTDNVFPMDGQSYGGNVRSGPGTNFSQVGDLSEGDHVVIIKDAGVMMNAYGWFEINYGDGKTGFQWGKLLCSSSAYSGIYQQCAGDDAGGQNSTNKLSVTFVEHSGGSFTSNGDGTWTEKGTDGAANTYVEQGRDNTNINLYDSARNVHLQFDLRQMIILYVNGDGPAQSLYRITHAS
ncbi:MAG: SH3 domain-containing protein [Devosiaceae bacterium]|nr:SH3 domain-containing protein [Devosiaceae bacterium]